MPHPEVAAAVMPLTEIAFAKVNLALHVRGRREDGYHELESLFAFAEDGDVLRAETGETLSLTIEGPFASVLAADGDNLVLRAAQALRDCAGRPLGAHIVLDKRLPVASGIGGGSADAAAALRLLARLWHIALPDDRLLDLALSLGSDVPACIVSRTQFVGGRGERLAQVMVDGLGGAALLLVNPRVPLSTGPVFAGWDRIDRGSLDAGSLDSLAMRGRNDLELSALALAPVIADMLDALRAQDGVTLARMSGSGATCFALFGDDAARDAAEAAIRAAHPGWWLMGTRIRAA